MLQIWGLLVFRSDHMDWRTFFEYLSVWKSLEYSHFFPHFGIILNSQKRTFLLMSLDNKYVHFQRVRMLICSSCLLYPKFQFQAMFQMTLSQASFQGMNADIFFWYWIGKFGWPLSWFPIRSNSLCSSMNFRNTVEKARKAKQHIENYYK